MSSFTISTNAITYFPITAIERNFVTVGNAASGDCGGDYIGQVIIDPTEFHPNGSIQLKITGVADRTSGGVNEDLSVSVCPDNISTAIAQEIWFNSPHILSGDWVNYTTHTVVRLNCYVTETNGNLNAIGTWGHFGIQVRAKQPK